MEDFKPKVVACRCGWQGEERQLHSIKEPPAQYCPACGRNFKPYFPVYSSKPADEE